MCKLKISLLLLVLTSSVLCEENNTDVKPQSEKLIQPIETTTTEEPSFFYKWTSWFNPFSRSSQDNVPDLISEATHLQYAPQYLAPAQNNYQQKLPCNPCDKEPWIPIAGHNGRNTVIGFVKPSHLGKQELPQLQNGYGVPLQNGYGPPPQFRQPLNSYGAPAVTQALPDVHQVPPARSHYKDQFGYATNNKPSLVLPPSDNSYRTLTNKFMPPPPQKGLGYNYHRLKPAASKFNFHNKPSLGHDQHNKPSLGHGPPIPLNFEKQNQNYAPQFSNNFQKVPNKLVPPSTSYGVPIRNDLHASNTHHLSRYPQLPLNPPNDFHLNLAAPLAPIPFPQLSLTPVAPLHNYQPFHNVPNNYLQPTFNAQRPEVHDVQVVPSIQVANYLASIEHPINVIQSPLVDVNASDFTEQIGTGEIDGIKSLLNENPIVVEDDNNAAASVQNATYHNPDQNGKRHNDKDIGSPFLLQSVSTPPPLEYNNWTPYKTLTTAINPPPVQDHSWFSSTLNEDQFVSSTKKPKQVQIIIPYTSQTNGLKESKNPLSIFTVPPPQQEALWTKYIDYNTQESNRITASTVGTERPYSTVINIKDLLLNEKLRNVTLKNSQYDIVRLQKNIDVWTEREYSKNEVKVQKDSTVGKLVPSKHIPSEYLTTQPYRRETTTVRLSNHIVDHDTAASTNQLIKFENIDDNLITNSESTEVPTTTDEITTTAATTIAPSSSLAPAQVILPLAAAKSMWEKLQVQVSPLTKEKVYVVTPQPWNFTPEEINQKLLRIAQFANIPISSPKFSVIIQPDVNASANKSREVIKDAKDGLQVVYSEWPHLINNLLTSTTEKSKAVTKHPLFGLMDISSYTPPPNSTVETYGGHSKVITVVTPVSVAKKKVKNDKLTKH